MRRGQRKTLPWNVWLKTLKGDLMEITELTPNKLNILCEVDWPAFGVGWPLEGSLDKTVVNEVYRIIVKIKNNNNKKETLKPRRMGKAKRLKLVFKKQTLIYLNSVAIYHVN
jgi:hypothetical protein